MQKAYLFAERMMLSSRGNAPFLDQFRCVPGATISPARKRRCISERACFAFEVVIRWILSVQYHLPPGKGIAGDRLLGKTFDSKKFLERWKQRKRKEEWLFALAIVKAGLEREGNLDQKAEQEIEAALRELDISPETLQDYLEKNRANLLRFLDSGP
jgi:hypothetical protein